MVEGLLSTGPTPSSFLNIVSEQKSPFLTILKSRGVVLSVTYTRAVAGQHLSYTGYILPLKVVEEQKILGLRPKKMFKF